MVKKTEKWEYANIPEYASEDSLGDRLVALVRLEQFMDENTFTPGVMADLEDIIEKANRAGDRKIATMAGLILDQSRKYL